MKTKEQQLERTIHEQNAALSKIAQISEPEAKQLLLVNLKREFNQEAADIYKNLVDKAKGERQS